MSVTRSGVLTPGSGSGVVTPMTTSEFNPATLSPRARAKYDAAPEWMRTAAWAQNAEAWERDPEEAAANQRAWSNARRDPRKVRRY